MRLTITLSTTQKQPIIPVNYQYPLSAAIYKILEKGDSAYAEFLHESGYGKGFKLFCFSQINCPFLIYSDRLLLKRNELDFKVAFHLPLAAENFIKGLFQSEQLDVADKHSRAHFVVKSIESLPNPLAQFKENELAKHSLVPHSPVVAGIRNEKGNYDFLPPGDPRFIESLISNWRNKIAACYDDATAESALLMIEVVPIKQPFKSRLITIKADTPEETKIRGWMNFQLNVTGERRFVDLLMNAGTGVYNAQGMGFVEAVKY